MGVFSEKLAQLSAGDPTVSIDSVKCVEGFCGIEISKPVAASTSWESIADYVMGLGTGERRVLAGEYDGVSTAVFYVAHDQAYLPIASGPSDP
jgi:hypothetical protein